MKNKIALFLLVCIISFSFTKTVHASESYCEISENCGIYDRYRYVSFGTGPIILIPNVGLGYRARHVQWGWDSSISFSTIGYAHQLAGHLVGHRYLSPFRQNSCYLGFGVLGSGIFVNDKSGGGTLSPDFVIGRELLREGAGRHFIEMHVAVPTFWADGNGPEPLYLPLMYIKYGIGF